MYIDYQLEMANAQAETTVAAHISTNVIDLGVAGDADEELFLVVQIDAAVTSDGSATVAFKLVTSDVATLDGAGAVTLWETAAIAKATLVAGYQVAKVRVPRGLKRYVGLFATIGTAALTGGTFSAFLTKNIDNNDL